MQGVPPYSSTVVKTHLEYTFVGYRRRINSGSAININSIVMARIAKGRCCLLKYSANYMIEPAVLSMIAVGR